jgi:peptide/nickel transport system permease protein
MTMPSAEILNAGAAAPKRMTPWQWAGVVILVSIGLFGLIAPAIGGDPLFQDLDHVMTKPGPASPLGTDHLGRSMFARLGHATRLSLFLAVLSVLTAAIPGTILGVAAAWRARWTDTMLSTIADGVLALPGLLLIVLLTAFGPGKFWPFYVGLSLALWVEYFRVVRAASQTLLRSPQVEASRLLGFGPVYIVRRHLLPELISVLRTLMTFGAATSVLSLAALGLVGVGLRPPTPELGTMMIELLPHYHETPWLIAEPVFVLLLAVTGLALLAGERKLR